MAKKIATISTGEDGVPVVTESEMPPEMAAQVKESEAVRQADEAEQSMGARRLAAARARRGPKIERVEIEGEEWFCGRLDWPGINKVLLLSPRNERGELDMNERNILTGFTAALIYCGTFESAADDAAPAFESPDKDKRKGYAQALEYVQEPDTAATVVALYLKLIEINPLLDSKKKA